MDIQALGPDFTKQLLDSTLAYAYCLLSSIDKCLAGEGMVTQEYSVAFAAKTHHCSRKVPLMIIACLRSTQETTYVDS